MQPNLNYLTNLEPEEIIKWYQSKGNRFSWNWRDTLKEAHARAFTAAKVMKLDILQDIRKAQLKTFTDGITFREFQKELEPLLKSKGWWGKVKAKDVPGYKPMPGLDPNKVVQLGSPKRLKTIYDTNASVGYSSGRYKTLSENAKNRPYWQYIQMERPSKREEHSRLHNKVFRWDNPIWNTIFPPNGWYCSCRVRGRTKGELREDKLTVSKGKDFTDFKPDEGWDYNPGEAAFFPDLDKYDYDIATQYLSGGLTSPDFDLFYNGKTKGNYPVAVINDQYKKLLNVETKAVVISDESLQKNKLNHSDLTNEDYKNIPSIISGAQLIIKKGTENLLFVKRNGKYFAAVVKITQDRSRLFLTSFRRTNLKDINLLKRSGKIIYDKLK